MAAKRSGSRLDLDLLGGKGRHRTARSQLRVALTVLALVVGGGTLGYVAVEGWGLLDAFYMIVLTLSTVGYGEVHPLTPGGQILSIIVIVTGVGAAAYAVGTAGKLVLEDRIRAALGRKHMKAISKLRDHYIICGFGRMGRIICEELTEKKVPFVVLENSQDALEELERFGYPHMRADATNDEELVEAGIDRAAGLVSVVTDDAQNVFIVLTARGLNPRLNIVARSASEETIKKLVRAGANKVVSPYYLGGFRIAQAVTSPTVLDFLDSIVHDKTMDLRLEEVKVAPGSKLVGTTLATSGLRRDFNLIIVAIKGMTGAMDFNPAHDTQIKAGDTLVILGHRPDLLKLAEIVRSP